MNEEEKIERIAKAVHEINFGYCEAIGDSAQHWNEAPETVKASVRAGVKMHLDNPHVTPAESHQAWYAFKAKDGWRFGVEKDFDKKTHPCFLPYNELPERQRAKDYIFKNAVEQFKNF